MIENYFRKFETCDYDYHEKRITHELRFDDIYMSINISGFIRETTNLSFQKPDWLRLDQHCASSKLNKIMRSLSESKSGEHKYCEWTNYDFGLAVEVGSIFSLLLPYESKSLSQVEIVSTNQDIFSSFP